MVASFLVAEAAHATQKQVSFRVGVPHCACETKKDAGRFKRSQGKAYLMCKMTAQNPVTTEAGNKCYKIPLLQGFRLSRVEGRYACIKARGWRSCLWINNGDLKYYFTSADGKAYELKKSVYRIR